MQQRTTTAVLFCSVLFCDVFISAWLCASRSVWVYSGIVCLICVSLRYVPPVISYTQIRFESLNWVWLVTHICILQLLFEKSKLLLILWYSWIFAGGFCKLCDERMTSFCPWLKLRPMFSAIWPSLLAECTENTHVMTQTIRWVFT